MPKPCLEESRLIVEELCGSFTRGNQSEIDRMTVLSHYGFNEKDIGDNSTLEDPVMVLSHYYQTPVWVD